MLTRYARNAFLGLLFATLSMASNGLAKQTAQHAHFNDGTASLSGDRGPVWVTFQNEIRNYRPPADALIQQIESLALIPELDSWSTETLSILGQLSQEELSAGQTRELYERLESQANVAREISEVVRQRCESSTETKYDYCEVARLSYRIKRRLAIWNLILDSKAVFEANQQAVTHSFGTVSVSHQRLLDDLAESNIDPVWRDYLMLESLASVMATASPGSPKIKTAAREVLARIYSPVLDKEQASYVMSAISPYSLQLLKDVATLPFDEMELFRRIENYESNPSSLTGYYLNDQYQNLLWSEKPDETAMARAIETHYRNANIRLAFSERFLNRLLPKLPEIEQPVDQKIKGARVLGKSRISNQLRVNLIPDDTQIQLNVETRGDVQSDTVAKTKVFKLTNLGRANFEVFQNIMINEEGIEAVGDPYARAKANQLLVGVESGLDNHPILGGIARKIAKNNLKREASETDRMYKQTVESSVEEQMREQVGEQLQVLRELAYTKLFQPLFGMDLEPEPKQLSTTEDQMVVRYRIGGRDQMAANTARPLDRASSLMSFQLHQSAINNAISRIGLNGNKFTVDELVEHLKEFVGAGDSAEPRAKSDKHAEIGFAYFDPILVEFQEDQLKVTLNLKSLKIGEKGKVWKNVSLTAAYRFVRDGMKIQLQQNDDGTRIRGKRLRFGDKAAISTVMKVLFKKEYSVASLPEKIAQRIDTSQLEISQLSVSDGWLAVSVDDRELNTAQETVLDILRTSSSRKLINRR
ncbi:hypothetical protein N9A76_02075 [Mariniblastus sp.]|nr:hypothetical protein [Mariniblastus sp.]MDA7880219.1 hypothetical protein [Mariniblastus sp.]